MLKPKITKTCIHCGRSFKVYPYRADTALYCSHSCSSAHHTGEDAIHWKGGKIAKICQHCGKTYFVDPARENKSKFCSRACLDAGRYVPNKGQDTRIPRECPHCHKKFIIHPNNDQRKYCSRECHDAARMKRVTLVCVNCHKEYEEQLSKSDHKFCGLKCRDEYMVGENSALWRGGISFEPYPKSFNGRFKRAIRKRDNHTCAICGCKGASDVHHKDYCKASTTPENCVTLCHSCHTKTSFNREYWLEYFSKLY